MTKLFDDGLEWDSWNGVPVLKDKENRTVWVSSKSMQQLFGIKRNSISESISTYLRVGEKDRTTIVRKFRTIGKEDVGDVEHFRLEAVLFVGMRAHLTTKVVNFIFWVIDVLIDYIITGVAENKDGALIKELQREIHSLQAELYGTYTDQ